MAMQKEIGSDVTHDRIKEYLWKTLKSGQVVPGYGCCMLFKKVESKGFCSRYGHGVLRNPDPRFIALQEFCDSKPELQDSPIIQLVKKVRGGP